MTDQTELNMRAVFSRIGLVLVAFHMWLTGYCQDFSDEQSQTMHFVYQVKEIDEFFERFNNDSISFLRDFYHANRLKYQVQRSKLIKTLFNYETQLWDTLEINRFVSAVSSKRYPQLLDFPETMSRQSGWLPLFPKAN